MIILAEKSAGQNSAYRHRKYEGRFRKRRRPSLLEFDREYVLRTDGQSQATEGLSFDFFCSSGRTFSTNASAVMPCFLRRIGTAPCSMN